MGCWSVACGVSNIAITEGQECCIIPLYQINGFYHPYMLPIFGTYNDYGGLNDIVKDKNVELIETAYNSFIEDFLDHLQPTNNDKVIYPSKYLSTDKLRYIWVDKKVYDFLSTVEEHNYKPFFTSTRDKYETTLSYAFGCSDWYRYKNYYEKEANNNFVVEYFNNKEVFTMDMIKLLQMTRRFSVFSYRWTPYELYLTPQGGDRIGHQIVLDKFSEIHKSYMNEDREYSEWNNCRLIH